jgi:predicted metal-dependent hydrolase
MPSAPVADPSQLFLWSDEPAVRGTGLALPAAPANSHGNLRHPRANREAHLNGHLIGYEFRRVRRKTIGFSVAREGLIVSAPRWVPVGEVEAALQEKSRWILKKLQEQDERARRLAQQRIDWRDGTSLPFLGETVIVVLDPRCTGSVLETAQDTLPGVPRLTLHVGLPQQASPEQIRDAVQSWLQRQAKRVFEERCHHFAQQLGVRWTRLSLSSAATRWGSASADGAIRLHWRLIHFALPTIDYVVAHELAHLRVMDHSPRFWDVVRSVIPDVDRLRDGLRDEALPAFD